MVQVNLNFKFDYFKIFIKINDKFVMLRSGSIEDNKIYFSIHPYTHII